MEIPVDIDELRIFMQLADGVGHKMCEMAVNA